MPEQRGRRRIVRRWVDSRGSGSVGWFAWRNCAAVEAARLSAGERGIAMRRLLVAAALAYGVSTSRDHSFPFRVLLLQ